MEAYINGADGDLIDSILVVSVCLLHFSGFGDLVPLHPCLGQDTATCVAHVTIFTLMTLLYFTIGLAVVTSMMLSISAAMEDPSLLGFHQVANADQSTTCNDKEFD